jgi:hypothetical protein
MSETVDMHGARWAGAAPVLASSAAVLVVFALAVSPGFLDPVAIWMVTAATGTAIAAAALAGGGPERGRVLATAILVAGLTASWVHDLVVLPGLFVDPRRLGPFRPLLVAAGLVLLSYSWRHAPAWIRATRFTLFALATTAAAANVVLASRSPGIDVWSIQQAAARALLEGRNPYAIHYPNPYGPGTPFLDPSLLTPDGHWIVAFPYMPLVPILGAVGALAGDVRWVMLATTVASAFLIRALGRGSVRAELAAALLLLQPGQVPREEQEAGCFLPPQRLHQTQRFGLLR